VHTYANVWKLPAFPLQLGNYYLERNLATFCKTITNIYYKRTGLRECVICVQIHALEVKTINNKQTNNFQTNNYQTNNWKE